MTIDLARIRAVAAAMRGIRDRLVDGAGGYDDDCSTDAYNKWIAMLGGALNEDCEHLLIDADELPRSDLLVYLDAAVGFLESYASDGNNVTAFKPKAVE